MKLSYYCQSQGSRAQLGLQSSSVSLIKLVSPRLRTEGTWQEKCNHNQCSFVENVVSCGWHMTKQELMISRNFYQATLLVIPQHQNSRSGKSISATPTLKDSWGDSQKQLSALLSLCRVVNTAKGFYVLIWIYCCCYYDLMQGLNILYVLGAVILLPQPAEQQNCLQGVDGIGQWLTVCIPLTQSLRSIPRMPVSSSSPHVTPSPGLLIPSSDLCRPVLLCINTHTLYKQKTHAHSINKIQKLSLKQRNKHFQPIPSKASTHLMA